MLTLGNMGFFVLGITFFSQTSETTLRCHSYEIMDVAAVTEKLQFLLHCKVGKKLENTASSQGRMSRRLIFIYFKS